MILFSNNTTSLLFKYYICKHNIFLNLTYQLYQDHLIVIVVNFHTVVVVRDHVAAVAVATVTAEKMVDMIAMVMMIDVIQDVG